ncbi:MULTISPECIES: hypothetical protein [Xanthomonas]|uniref:Uncharacterized protein n=1 Tax=Xanthomonas campestris pv. phaseoli TaxID=317013 RepID=A0A7Z7NGN7_XANCH|nr:MULTISPECIES: hypothetical protein [Xanthomonas]QTD87939.1 hypothetical protein XcfCFBP6988P_23630 [Xanthomonas citri pv. phaseoli var. fuscans]QTF14026.1 hypothetical protein XcfCFBP6989P_23540 [Xanthomonas citri pv. phaseoli var. fuscans]QTF14247.1 hypothetical protein XcfCFBP6991P_24285 [Xanthomonas citri pv. phaseoli var. fuscans]QTF76222.1 hypothetical protein XcfCFBP6990P_23575 [Xanthomonas citri pv. phaseoli var. fuscans]UZA98031.1 hypothetical protein OM946_12525 [Xanthomonas citri 
MNKQMQTSDNLLRDGQPYEVNYDEHGNVASVFCGFTEDGLAHFVFPAGLGG